MDFVALVDQVIALLRQRGRVTYRTLQRQCQLDADALAGERKQVTVLFADLKDSTEWIRDLDVVVRTIGNDLHLDEHTTPC
jgi:class 3 adenylate cyclase